jgi:hypothetical protein
MVDALNLGRSEWIPVVHLLNEASSGTKLSCGVHDCPQRCHQLFDHSKKECRKIVESVCSRNHKFSRACFRNDSTCRVCEAEDHRQELKRRRDHKLEADRKRKEQEYARQLAELQDELAHERRILRDQSEQDERDNVLQQHRQDLTSLRENFARAKNIRKKDPSIMTTCVNQPSTTTDLPGAAPNPSPGTQQDMAKDQSKGGLDALASSAKDEWEHQKKYEGAQNEALDSVMDMIGLEDVKDKFLSIKSRVDTTVRQAIDMKGERFGATLLGNPGTGMY